MRRSARLPDLRPGFTLVELMVAMALIILIMAILSFAFQVGMDTLSQLKSIGGLSEQLRSAQATLEGDLRANHLEDPTGSPVRVSSLHSSPATALPWIGPNRGYFAVTQRRMGGALTGQPEGTESGIESWRGDSESGQTPGYHILRMTVQLSGQTAEETFSAAAPNLLPGLVGSLSSFAPPSSTNTMVSRWAEVVYFIRPNGLLTSSNDPAAQLPMYTLYRRQRLLAEGTVNVPDGGSTDPKGPPANFPDLSWQRVSVGSPNVNRMNTPSDVTNPANRLGGGNDPTAPPPEPNDALLTPDRPSSGPTVPWPTSPPSPVAIPFPYRIPGTTARFGSDVVLNNVVSFQVQTITDPPLGFIPGGAPGVSPGPNPLPTSQYTFGPGQFLGLPNSQPRPWTFDTAQNPPQAAGAAVVRLRAVQVKVRVYDTKNQQTRQITIIQDL
jgi:prepilin-type N-terminal cleavage/methylation domain-containing protein